MRIIKALSFDDVLLIPQRSSVLPRDTDVSTRLSRRIRLSIPIISAAMDTVTESAMALSLAKSGGIGIIHKNMRADEQAGEVEMVKKEGLHVGAAISTGEEQYDRARLLTEAGVDVLVVDTAHGHSKGVIDMVSRIKKDPFFKAVDVIAGNVSTMRGAYDLAISGADAVKVGMGPGSICTTRIVSGVGVPQITAIMDAVSGIRRAKKDIPVIADGGIKYSGDVAKAIGAGASSVMLGNLFAGTDEAPGEIVEREGKKYKTYRGMGSLPAMMEGSKDRYGQAGVAPKKLVPEGVSGTVPYRGPLFDEVYLLVGGLRASLGYLGARTIPEFQKKAKFIQITPAGFSESRTHGLSSIENTVNY